MEGAEETFQSFCGGIEGCEVLPSENSSVFILLLDSKDHKEEEEQLEQVKSHPDLQCLALVYGQLDESLKGDS
jgi:nitrate reductase NapAB chaperone NapD